MTRSVRRWLGIDFSGDNEQWKPSRAASTNVWLASLERAGESLRVFELEPVQGLPGDEPPLHRLAKLLASGTHEAAGIDAPFCIPHAYMGTRTHAALLAAVGGLACLPRYFPQGRAFVEAVTGSPPPLSPPKPYRETERLWANKGVSASSKKKLNVRSTLWAGARGGAPMTAACLALLNAAARPVWPFTASGAGLLVEAFPAAQLRQWNLPTESYGGSKGAVNRGVIVDALIRRGLRLGSHEAKMRAKADATDAVLCAFAAMAVTDAVLAVMPPSIAASEGWIAVHR
jgi:Protein of unknown function (DUF429)